MDVGGCTWIPDDTDIFKDGSTADVQARCLVLCRLFGDYGCVWNLIMLRLLVMCTVWHFCGWKCMSQSDSHPCRASRSSWRAFESWSLVINYGVVSKQNVLRLSDF